MDIGEFEFIKTGTLIMCMMRNNVDVDHVYDEKQCGPSLHTHHEEL